MFAGVVGVEVGHFGFADVAEGLGDARGVLCVPLGFVLDGVHGGVVPEDTAGVPVDDALGDGEVGDVGIAADGSPELGEADEAVPSGLAVSRGSSRGRTAVGMSASGGSSKRSASSRSATSGLMPVGGLSVEERMRWVIMARALERIMERQ